MKTKKEKTQESDKAAAAQSVKAAPAAEAVSDEDFPNELGEPRWSVVSFENCVETGLTYDEAAQKLKKLAAEDVLGLCVVTDEATAKILNSGKW
ncbi:hypothetical protein BH24ACI2_BH24ACI2_04610 [soil metagenome]